MDTFLVDLVNNLFDIGAIQFGRFTLHSGRTSSIYMDLRILVSYPTVLRQVAQAYQRILTDLQFDLLAAYPYAALPIGTAIALEMNMPLIYPRKEVKSYGTGKLIEGVWTVGQKTILIEDLITSGTSIEQAIASLKAAGLHIGEAVVLIDREQGGRQILTKKGYQLHAVVTMREILTILRDAQKITTKKQNQVLTLLEPT